MNNKIKNDFSSSEEIDGERESIEESDFD